jgi:hypothetical protein
MLAFLLCVLSSNRSLPFSLRSLQLNWAFSVARSSGLFGAPSDYFATGSVRSAVMKSNHSIRFRVSSSRPFDSALLHFNVTDDEISVFDANLSALAQLKCFWADTGAVFARGGSADGRYALSGLLGPARQSMLTITATDSDEVILIRASPPTKVEKGDLLRKLLPAIAIIFFVGFGRPYQKRFWRQYRQLNTRSLQNRMRETQSRARKAG